MKPIINEDSRVRDHVLVYSSDMSHHIITHTIRKREGSRGKSVGSPRDGNRQAGKTDTGVLLQSWA